ncbi:hypothetical protein ACHAXN_012663 [Cyclotella atomus]|jgi:hypothetical protein
MTRQFENIFGKFSIMFRTTILNEQTNTRLERKRMIPVLCNDETGGEPSSVSNK